jgi:hypothetical protein
MITYYYVPNKQKMLDLVIDRVYENIDFPPPEFGDWAERLHQIFMNARRELIRYPGLVPVIQMRPLSPNARRMAEAVDGLLLEAGIEESAVYEAAFAVYHYVLGALAWEIQARAGVEVADPHRSTTSISEAHMEQRFAFGVSIYLRGVKSLVEGKTSKVARATGGRHADGQRRSAARRSPLRREG